MLELLAQLTDDQKKKAFSNDKNNQDNEDNKMSLTDKILDKLQCAPSAKVMAMLAVQLTAWLMEDDKRKILSIALKKNQSAKGFCELLEQLKLDNIEYQEILNHLRKSYATDVLKLINGYLKNQGFVFNKDCYKCIFNYLDVYQSVDDVLSLLTEFNQLNINLTDNLIEKIMNTLLSKNQTLENVCKLLGGIKQLNINLTDDLIKQIIDKLKKDQTLENVCKLLGGIKQLNINLTDDLVWQIIDKLESISELKDFQRLMNQLCTINVPLKSSTVGSILNKFKSDRTVWNLIDLVECLKPYKIEQIILLCKPIISLLSKGKNRASDVTELLIDLCKLVNFECDKADLSVQDLLEKLEDNQQTTKDMIALAKILIVMG